MELAELSNFNEQNITTNNVVEQFEIDQNNQPTDTNNHINYKNAKQIFKLLSPTSHSNKRSQLADELKKIVLLNNSLKRIRFLFLKMSQRLMVVHERLEPFESGLDCINNFTFSFNKILLAIFKS